MIKFWESFLSNLKFIKLVTIKILRNVLERCNGMTRKRSRPENSNEKKGRGIRMKGVNYSSFLIFEALLG